MSIKVRAVITGVVMLTLGLLIYGASRSSWAGGPRVAPPPGDGSENKMAPDFELKTLDGRVVKLSDFRGKAVVLNFWATYCGPCRVEMPWLIALYNQYRSQGLEIVGVSMDDAGEEQKATDFVREFEVNYTILLGNATVGDAYGGMRYLPRTFFIDRKGQIKASATGLKSKQELESAIRKLVVN